MDKRLNEVTLIGYGLFVVYGTGLLFYLTALFLSWVEPSLITRSGFFSERFKTLASFQIHAGTLFVIFLPQLAGYYGVIQQRDWGRRLVIAMNVVLCVYVLVGMISGQSFGFLPVLTFLISILLILFFIQPKIRMQFEGSTAAIPLSDRRKVLIVDDDKGLLKMIRASLMYHGFDVYTAATGEKGLQTARRKKPNLIILDVILPGIKGREVCSRLKEDAETREIPVIFLTAKDSPDDVRAEMEVGAISHITKPINSQQLLVEIKKILGG